MMKVTTRCFVILVIADKYNGIDDNTVSLLTSNANVPVFDILFILNPVADIICLSKPFILHDNFPEF